jgi:hypothetical protein
MSLDLGQFSGNVTRWRDVKRECTQGVRPPPRLPEGFEAELESKLFTNGKEDYDKTLQLYRDAFDKHLGEAEILRYQNLQWGDVEAKQLAKVIRSGAMKSVHVLFLENNPIGEEGRRELVEAIDSGGAPNLVTCWLDVAGQKVNIAPEQEPN